LLRPDNATSPAMTECAAVCPRELSQFCIACAPNFIFSFLSN
jgi:hypothetical protein